jgi:hypothetical protein
MRKNLLPVLKTIFLILLPSLVISAPLTLQVNQVAKLTRVDGDKAVDLEANVPFVTDDKEPMFVKAKGKVPVLIIPQSSASQKTVKLSLVDVKDWPNRMTQDFLDQSLSELVETSVKIQSDLQMNKAVEALEKIEILQKKFPNLMYLNFFRASALVLQGKKSLAISSLKKALASHPTNEEGLKLLATLGDKQ